MENGCCTWTYHSYIRNQEHEATPVFVNEREIDESEEKVGGSHNYGHSDRLVESYHAEESRGVINQRVEATELGG
jgi:hypothetical protein